MKSPRSRRYIFTILIETAHSRPIFLYDTPRYLRTSPASFHTRFRVLNIYSGISGSKFSDDNCSERGVPVRCVGCSERSSSFFTRFTSQNSFIATGSSSPSILIRHWLHEGGLHELLVVRSSARVRLFCASGQETTTG
jgi:hypothetical protein